MKLINLLSVLISTVFFFGCVGIVNRSSDEANQKNTGNESVVRTTIHFEYLNETDKKRSKIYDEQVFVFHNIDDAEMLKRRFAVVTSYNPKESRPVGLGFSNIWDQLAKKKNPQIDLKFFFKTARIELNKTIECTSNEESECLIDIYSARQKMGIPTKNIACNLKIESEVKLDYSEFEPRPIWKGISFPSSIDNETFEGKPFAISVKCTSGSKSVISGYFQHNSSIVPNIDPELPSLEGSF